MSKSAERTGALLNIDLNRLHHAHRDFHIRRRGVTEQVRWLLAKELVSNSIYLVDEAERSGLKIGQVLVRNLELTRRLKSENELFVVYDNLFDAWRAMSRLNPRYKAEEIPAAEAWRLEGDELMKISWTLQSKMVDGQLEYSARAWRAIGPHQHVRNDHKKRALNTSVEATRVKDRRGRFNPGRLPLMYLTVDLALWARIQEAGRIGERMDHRAMVLQRFINAYTTAVSTTINDLEQLLRPSGVFGTGRTPNKVREAVKRIRMSVTPLDNLTARPFVHVFEHVGTDLSQAADLMEEAADNRDPVRMDAAKSFIHRSYRSLVLLQRMRLLQDFLAAVANLVHTRIPLTAEETKNWETVLRTILVALNKKDSFTGEPIEKDFINPILDRVNPHLEEAKKYLAHQQKLSNVHKHLKAALAPF